MDGLGARFWTNSRPRWPLEAWHFRPVKSTMVSGYKKSVKWQIYVTPDHEQKKKSWEAGRGCDFDFDLTESVQSGL